MRKCWSNTKYDGSDVIVGGEAHS